MLRSGHTYIVQRYDLPVDESSLESPSQCSFQFALYFSIVPLIFILQEIRPSDDNITSTYNDKLKFRDNFALSGIISIFAITMGQVKKNLIFQEFNISWKQWVCYFLASMSSTMFSICGITMFLIFNFGCTYVNGSDTSNLVSNIYTYGNPIADNILGLIRAIMGVFINQIITYITCSKRENLKLPASRFSWLTSLFTVSILPTSQLITRGYYNTYHNSTMKSANLLYRTAEQAGASFITLCFTVAFSSHEYMLWSKQPLTYIDCLASLNSTIIDVSRCGNKNISYLLPKTALSSDMKNYLIASLALLPVCSFLSYLFLWVYFHLDNGFFGTVEMDYFYYNGCNIDKIQDSENKMGSEEDNKLLTNRDNNDVPEQKTLKMDHEEIEKNYSKDWIENWIDEDVGEDWYRWLWRKFISLISHEKLKPIQKFDMAGIWMDLTGNDGQMGDCEDGAAVLCGEKGSLEYSIRMSFPFYWKQDVENVASCPTCSPNFSSYPSCSSCFCCFQYKRNDINEVNIEM